MYRLLTWKTAVGNKIRQAHKNIACAGERYNLNGIQNWRPAKYTVLKSNSFLTYFPDFGLCLARHKVEEHRQDSSVLQFCYLKKYFLYYIYICIYMKYINFI